MRVIHLLVHLLVAVAMAAEPSYNLASERSSIESTYELTKYLEYQLKEIKDVYLTYLGPPFNEKDFSPPRPNSTALTLPSAATRLELWHGLENQARLAQNQRAYSVLLAAVRELARSTLCPSLKTSLLHFCTGLDGLLGSISALMTSLGYSSPPQSVNVGSDAGELQGGTGGNRPAPLMSQNLYRSRAGSKTESGQRSGQRRTGPKAVRGERDDGASMDLTERRRGKEGRRADVAVTGGRSGGLREKGKAERGKREKREEPGRSKLAAIEWQAAKTLEEEVSEQKREETKWRRRLLNYDEDEEQKDAPPGLSVQVSYLSAGGIIKQQTNDNQYSFTLNSYHPDTVREEDGFIPERNSEKPENSDAATSSFSSYHQQHRPPRSLLSPTLQPPLSTLTLLYQFGAGEEHTLLPQTVPLSLRRGTTLLSPPLNPLFSSSTTSTSSLLSARPTMNDFARKVEGFWILRELQSWLWRSAKDFNRLKRRLRG